MLKKVKRNMSVLIMNEREMEIEIQEKDQIKTLEFKSTILENF